MTTLITEKEITKDYRSLTAISGKKEGLVYMSNMGITVLCKNASHKAFRGFGNCFNTFDEALNHYKSAEMKAIINLARAEFV